MLKPAVLFRAVSVLEAFSWIGLLSGMFVKYFTDQGDFGVKLFGPIHGGVFVLYLVVTAVTAVRLKWSRGTVFWAMVASIPPLATILFERYALRTGKLDPMEMRKRFYIFAA